MQYLLFPMQPSPTRVVQWGTESSPQWENLSKQEQGSTEGIEEELQRSVAIGGGATIELRYEGLDESEVASLYMFWQSIVAREQARETSVFRISPVHCLWALGHFPRTYQLVNNLWAISNKQLTFDYMGQGECGPLMRVDIQLVSVPEVLAYE